MECMSSHRLRRQRKQCGAHLRIAYGMRQNLSTCGTLSLPQHSIVEIKDLNAYFALYLGWKMQLGHIV